MISGFISLLFYTCSRAGHGLTGNLYPFNVNSTIARPLSIRIAKISDCDVPFPDNQPDHFMSFYVIVERKQNENS